MKRLLVLIGVLSLSLPSTALASPTAVSSLVSVGSPVDTTPQNHQNEPAVAVDAHNPSVLAAGSNDFLDW